MSINKAIACFDENKKLIGEPMNNPQAFNLNQGLAILAREIDSELSSIRSDIRKLSSQLDAVLSAVLHR